MSTLYIFTLPPPKKTACAKWIFSSLSGHAFQVIPSLQVLPRSVVYPGSIPVRALASRTHDRLSVVVSGSPFITTPLTFITYYLDFCSTSIIFPAKCQYLLRNKSLRHTRKYSRTNQKAICTINKQTATQSSATCSRP